MWQQIPKCGAQESFRQARLIAQAGGWPGPPHAELQRGSYDLLWTDREMLYWHPVPSPKTPATHSMEIRFILEFSSPEIYHGSQYLSKNCVPAPKTHYSQ